jgi:putative inorganic carbon (HCO3(-)) transporter
MHIQKTYNSSMAKNKESAIDRTTERLLQVLVFVLPLIFFTFTLNFWELWKVTALRLGAGVLAGVAAVKIVRGKGFVVRRTPLMLPIIFLITVTAVSTFLSVDPLKSLFGEHRRFGGMLTLVAWVFLFVSASTHLRRERAKDGVLWAWLLSGSLVSLYAILQYLGIDFRVWSETGFDASRSFSTMGNPVKLASYLAFSIPVFLSQVFANHRTRRYLFAGALPVAGLALLATDSRAGVLGLFAGVLSLGFFASRGAKRGKRILLLSALGLIVVMSIAIVTTGLGVEGLLHSGSLGIRWQVWQSTLRMIAERPLFGFGLDTFRLVFPQFQTWDLIREQGRSAFDRPHNDLLQVGFSLGLVGLAIFIWLVLTFFTAVLRDSSKQENDKRRWTDAGFLAGIVGYLASIQFSFDSVAAGSLLWIVMGMMLSDNSRSAFVAPRPRFRSPKAAALFSFALFFLALAILTPAADYFAGKGKINQELNLSDSAREFYRSSIALAPWETLYRLRLGEALMDEYLMANRGSGAEAEAVFKQVSSLSPRETEAYLGLSALKLREQDFETAASYAEKALALDPFSVDGYLDLGLAKSARGDGKGANSLWGEALKIEPTNYYALLYLAQTNETAGHQKEALSFYEKILALYPYDSIAGEARRRLSYPSQQ